MASIPIRTTYGGNQPMRRRLSYANVTATLALVFAMSGGALAANHYLINSTKQINPKVLKKLKGSTGKTGAAGATGATGPKGQRVKKDRMVKKETSEKKAKKGRPVHIRLFWPVAKPRPVFGAGALQLPRRAMHMRSRDRFQFHCRGHSRRGTQSTSREPRALIAVGPVTQNPAICAYIRATPKT